MDQLLEMLDTENAPLPEELQAELDRRAEEKMQRIEAFANSLVKKRDEAVKGRAATGIEQDWAEDEEYYQGIDDANRDQARQTKPATMSGSVIESRPQTTTRSTVFLNITRPYVDAAAARVSDMLLPTDDRNWGFDPTPVPELDAQREDFRPVDGLQVPVTQADATGRLVPTGQNRQGTVADLVEQKLTEARKRADAAQRRVDDWLTQAGYHREMRKVIKNAAKLGTGILKGPFPIKRKARKVNFGETDITIELIESIDPASKSVDPSRFYPDPACGGDIHKGSYTWESDDITCRGLRDLKGVPGYIDHMIDKVIEEGPKGRSQLNQTRTLDDDKFEIWYYHGFAEKDDLEALGCSCESMTKTTGIPVVVTVVNDTPIKAVLSPLDTGEFPYDLMPWQSRDDMPWGTGVARQMRTPQRILNAATRNMMDNAGLSNGPQIVIRDKAIVPLDGRWEIVPRKFWKVSADFEGKSVGDAITSINIQCLQNELQAIIQFALKMAEDITGLPMILQGQQGQAPDTVGGMQLLQNNAGSVLRGIAKAFDDHITVPHMTRYYDWLMFYGEEPEEKGDFQIVAHGSSTLVERDLQNQAILGMGNMVLNPIFELSPAKWIKEAMRSQKLDPKRFEMDDEEKQAAAQRQQPPAPAVQAAQIRAEAQLKSKQIDAQVQEKRIQVDTDRDAVYVQAEMNRNQMEHDARVAELQLRRELAMLEYANQNKMSLESIRADLAKESMRLTTQKELAGLTAATKAPQIAEPAVEPPGKAPSGEAFQK